MSDQDQSSELEWRRAVVEAQRALGDYVEHLRAHEEDDGTLDRMWLRLWRAERTRDALFIAGS